MTVREELDKLRLKAFRTNADSDRQAYFSTLSHYWQNYKIVTTEEATNAGAKGWPFTDD